MATKLALIAGLLVILITVFAQTPSFFETAPANPKTIVITPPSDNTIMTPDQFKNAVNAQSKQNMNNLNQTLKDQHSAQKYPTTPASSPSANTSSLSNNETSSAPNPKGPPPANATMTTTAPMTPPPTPTQTPGPGPTPPQPVTQQPMTQQSPQVPPPVITPPSTSQFSIQNNAPQTPPPPPNTGGSKSQQQQVIQLPISNNPSSGAKPGNTTNTGGWNINY